MAARKSNKSNNNDKRNEEMAMSEQTTDTVNNDTVTDETPDNGTDNVTPDNGNMAETPEMAANAEAIEADAYVFPTDPNTINFGDDMADVVSKRFLDIVAQINAVDNIINAAQEGDSTPAILAYANSDTASQNVKAILAEYNAIKANLDNALMELSGAVKSEKGDVTLTPEQLDEKRNERKSHVDAAKTAIKFMGDYVENNADVPDDAKKFYGAMSKAIGRAGRIATTSTTSTTSTSGSAGTQIRPRLGSDGYILVNNETRYRSFTPAVKELAGLTGRSISASELHHSWADVAGFGNDLTKWNECENGDYSFTIPGKNEGETIPVTIHFTGKTA